VSLYGKPGLRKAIERIRYKMRTGHPLLRQGRVLNGKHAY